MTPEPSIQRLEDLLAQQATEGLTPAEEAELVQLLAKWPHVDEEGFEQAAAAIAMSIPRPRCPGRSPPGWSRTPWLTLPGPRAGSGCHGSHSSPAPACSSRPRALPW